MTEDEIRDLFREMRDEPLPADSLARVHLGVAERIQVGSWTRVFTPWRVAAVLMSAGLVLIALLLRTSAPVSKPAAPVVAHQIEAPLVKPALPAIVAVQKRRPSHRIVRQVRRIDKTPEAGGAAVIRIETPDPDVLILLIGD